MEVKLVLKAGSPFIRDDGGLSIAVRDISLGIDELHTDGSATVVLIVDGKPTKAKVNKEHITVA